MRRTVLFLLRGLSGYLAVPLLLLLRLARGIVRVRLCIVGSQRFGHLALEPEVRLSLNSCVETEGGEWLVDLWSFGNRQVQSNQTLANLWSREIRFAPRRIVGALVRGGERFPSLALEHVRLSIHGPANALERSDSTLKRLVPAGAQKVLELLGTDPCKPYVCLVVRDSDYYTNTGARESSGYQLLNFRVSEFEEAARYLSSEGFAVIRVGAPTTNSVLNQSVILDYANSVVRSELRDLQLIRDCSFVISTQTGPDAVALAMRRKVLYIDTLRFSQFFFGTSLATWNPVSFLPPGSSEPLSLSQLADSPFVWMEDPDDFAATGFQFRRSTSTEIVRLVESFLAEARGAVSSDLGQLRREANERLASMYGDQGATVWGKIIAPLNGWWLQKNAEWFLNH